MPKVKPTLHWCQAHAITAEGAAYDRLFTSESPGQPRTTGPS